MNRFVQLIVHSHYSIMDGCANIRELVDAAIKNRMPGIAITDNGNMFGIPLRLPSLEGEIGMRQDVFLYFSGVKIRFFL